MSVSLGDGVIKKSKFKSSLYLFLNIWLEKSSEPQFPYYKMEVIKITLFYSFENMHSSSH